MDIVDGGTIWTTNSKTKLEAEKHEGMVLDVDLKTNTEHTQNNHKNHHQDHNESEDDIGTVEEMNDQLLH